MGRDDLRAEIARLSKMLSSTKWPRGAATLPGIGDADVDLAEFDGFVAGLASSFLQNAPLRVKRIPLSRRLAAAFDRTLPSMEDDAVLDLTDGSGNSSSSYQKRSPKPASWNWRGLTDSRSRTPASRARVKPRSQNYDIHSQHSRSRQNHTSRRYSSARQEYV